MANINKTSIPDSVADDVCFKSNHRCCVCETYGGQIHHLVENNNHTFDNLAFLCLSCHDEATKTGGMTRKLSAGEIQSYRELHYKKIEELRSTKIAKLDSDIDHLTEEVLLTTVKNALIILKIDEIKEEFFGSDVNDRDLILNKLTKYAEHTNYRVAFAVLEFLHRASSWNNLNTKVASSIAWLTMDFCPSFWFGENREAVTEIAKMSLDIGRDIVFEGAVDLNNFDVVMYGLTIIKYVYRFAGENKIGELISEVDGIYNDMKETLKRYDRLDQAIELVSVFKADLESRQLAFPVLPPHLMNVLYEHRARHGEL